MPTTPHPNNKPWQKRTRQRLRTHGTPAEAALWLRLRRVNGLKFRRQFGVGPYVLDFYCPSVHLAVEVDGAVHGSPAQAAYDAERTRRLEGEGIRMIRFENRDVLAHPDEVVAAISKAATVGPR